MKAEEIQNRFDSFGSIAIGYEGMETAETDQIFSSVFLYTFAIKAKDFAAEMTSVNVQQKDLHGQVKIEQEQIDNNTAVCSMLLDRGIRPEALPPAEDIKKVERRLKSEEKKILSKKRK